MHDEEQVQHASATFSYLKTSHLWKTVRPYFIHIPQGALPKGQATTNEESIEVHDVRVKDVRSSDETFKLDKQGFEVVRQDLFQYVDESVYSGQFTKSAYADAVQEMLKGRLGAEQVISLGGTMRERDQSFPARTWGTKTAQQPIQGVHVDSTPTDARHILRRKLGAEEAERLKGRRIQILNTWQPLFGPIKDWPLAVMDCRSVDVEHDLIVRDAVYPRHVSESFQVFHNPKHQWYYLADQMPEEMWLFKSYDSKAGVANFCPHAAFDLKIEGQRPRQDADMMWLIIYSESDSE